MARKPKAGERVKVGRRSLVLPAVPSMTDDDPVALATIPDGGKPEKPTDELSEELIRTIKAAYQ